MTYGTLLLCKPKHKKKSIHQILITGRLQLFKIGGCQLNIINIYNYSASRNDEEEIDLMEKLANLLKAIEYQPTLTIGDFNFDSKGTQSKDVKWHL